MSNYTAPADLADGTTWTAALYNTLKNGLAAFLNNGNLGNGNVSANPAEKIAGSKINPDPGAHGARHAAGGADPLPANAISGTMLQSGIFSDDKLTERRDADATTATNLGLTYNANRAPRAYAHGTATSQPQGRGVVRSGKVYFSLYNFDKVTQLDPVTGIFTDIALSAGDKPGQLLLVGTDIYVLCRGGGTGGQQIKKIDVNNAVTTICNMRTDGLAAVADLIDVDEMAYHPSGGFIFCIGKRTGDTVYRVLLRVSLAVGTGVTHKVDLGVTSTPQFAGCITASNGVVERVAVLYHDTVPTNQIKSYAAADLTAVGSLAAGFTVGATSALVWDGAWAVGTGAGTNDIRQFEFLTQTNPILVLSNSAGAVVFAAPALGDGRHLYFSGSGATRPTIIPIASPVLASANVGDPRKIVDDPGSACVVNGFATDGASLWIAISNGATSNARIARLPL